MWPYAKKSISDWKNEYFAECDGCQVRDRCGGFFSSARLRYSDHIQGNRQLTAEMNGFRYTWLLSLMVLVLAGFISLYWFKARELSPVDHGATVADSDGRNDRSTPPTFILPATPAVAREQELRLREHSDKRLAAILNKCAAELDCHAATMSATKW